MNPVTAEELDALAERIARLVENPDDVKSTFGKLARPVLRALRWQPTIATERILELAQRLSHSESAAMTLEAPVVEACAARAFEELESNVSLVERACVAHGRIPLAYASWLWRIYQVIRRVHDWTRAPEDAFGLRSMLATPTTDLFPPLVAKRARDDTVTPVVAVDPLLRAARDETRVLGRRRRLLESARTLLLDASAALELDEAGTEARTTYIAGEIARLDRLEAAGISPEVAISYQLRQALDRGQTERVHAGLVALEGFALERGDGKLGKLTARALDDLWGKHSRFDARARKLSLAKSAEELLSPRVLEAIDKGHALGEAREDELDPVLERAEIENRQLQKRVGGVEHTAALALLADGCFEVGGPLSPVRVTDVRRTPRVVRFPTPNLVLAHAHGVEDLPDAVVEDPRLVLLSLASGKLLARRFLADELEPISRTVLAGEVRLYVLDGSSSMIGPRARMRDAILVAELSTLAARLADARRKVRPTLYYRYFTDTLGALQVVEDEGQALSAIEHVLSGLQMGATDIQHALIASFERIGEARKNDPNLARAQIVLVTDGESPIDQGEVIKAREAVGEIPVGVSIIALGQENPALRALAAHQRARGEAVFYHFTSDAALRQLATNASSALPLHLPKRRANVEASALVREVIDEIEMLERGSDLEDLARARHEPEALAELGLTVEGALHDADLARVDANQRDDRTLRRRFERWFPAPAARLGEAPEPIDTSAREDLDLVVTLLASVAEVVDLVGSDPLRRQADAIEIFERLLYDAGVAPWRYAELMKAHPEELAAALKAVRSSSGA